MSILSLDIFSSIVSNPDYNYHEIKINDFDIVQLIISDKNNIEYTQIEIKSLPVDKLLNKHLLPDNLKKLSINGYMYHGTKIDLLNNLPSKLEKLHIENINSKLDNLPLDLKVLELYGNCSRCCLDYLPSSLNTLVIQSNFAGSLDNLPSTLKNLFLMSEYVVDLKNLPRGLKFLHLNSHAKINIMLPDKIECVIYPEDNNWLRRKLLKLYPKIIHNDNFYENKIEMYHTLEFTKTNNEDYSNYTNYTNYNDYSSDSNDSFNKYIIKKYNNHR